MFASLLGRLARSIGAALREHRWGVVVSALALVVYLATFSAWKPPGAQPGSDGHYIWLYARSLAYDGDVDFANDYELCGDPNDHAVDRGTGHKDNPFYVGPSIFWVPAIWLVRPLVHFPPNADKALVAGCRGVVPQRVLVTACFAGALAVFLAYCASRRIARDGPAAFTAGLFAFGTTLGAYAATWPSYSHVYEAACLAALLVLSLRASERPLSFARWALAGLALAACILHRPNHALFGILPATLACMALWRRWLRLAASIAVCAAVAALLGLAPQLMLFHYLYGKWLAVPQGRYYLQPAHAHPWLLAFGPKGLFFMAPVVWLSVVGFALAMRRRPLRPLYVAMGIAIVCTVYVASMPLDWDGASSLGARRLIVLVPLFAMLATHATMPVIRWLTARPWRMQAMLAGAVLAMFGVTFVGAGLVTVRGKINYDHPVPQAEQYGDGAGAFWASVDESVGALAILPAQQLFAWRYHLKKRAYYSVLELDGFDREYRTLKVRKNQLDLGEAHARGMTTGFEKHEGGARLAAHEGTVVFTPSWPHATHFIVRATASRETKLHLESRTFFGRVATIGDIELAADVESAPRIAVPAGAYDSGINEVVITGDVAAGIVVKRIEFFDDADYVPAFQ